MSTPSSTSRLLRRLARPSTRSLSARHPQTCRVHSLASQCRSPSHRPTQRAFSTSITARAGLMPDTSEPQPPQDVSTEPRVTQPTEIADEEYHERADEYLEVVRDKAEELAEGREDIEVEYSAGVLNITFPPHGTYVLNKQPPNKQIWLASPLSGPKRFDWVLAGEGMQEKEGGGTGEWVYLRDGHNLTSLLAKELGIFVMADGEDKKTVDPMKGVDE